MNKLISLRLPDTLYVTIENISNTLGYNSMQDYIRETLRDRLIRDKVMILAGSQKGKGKFLTKDELNKLALDRFPPVK